MSLHKFVFAFALTVFALGSSALADPKAYDLVQYRGSAAGLVIAFDFADGYPEASEMRVTEKRGRTRFLPTKGARCGLWRRTKKVRMAAAKWC